MTYFFSRRIFVNLSSHTCESNFLVLRYPHNDATKINTKPYNIFSSTTSFKQILKEVIKKNYISINADISES